MREILLFGGEKKTTKFIQNLERSRIFRIIRHPLEDWKKILKNEGSESKQFVYFSLEGISPTDHKKIIRVILRQDNLFFGIIDPDGNIADPADLFHSGAADYCGPGMIKEGISATRLKQVFNFCSIPVEEKDTGEKEEFIELSWQDIEEGKEYPFFFLFAEIDLTAEWKMKSGKSHIDKLLESFYGHMEKVLRPYLPYNSYSCPIIIDLVRTVLNRVIISTEEYGYHTLVTYRFALHAGTTVYQSRGKTGTIISEAVNFIFHFGNQFAKPGNFYLSESTIDFIPEGLSDWFTHEGVFHDQEIYRMLIPLP
jgi:hypothetical protein